MKQAVIVPLCPNDNCNKPLHSPNDRVYLWVRSPSNRRGEQMVFCSQCATQMKDGDPQ